MRAPGVCSAPSFTQPSTYFFAGATKGYLPYGRPIAASITAIGRSQLLLSKQIAEDEFGMRVIYGGAFFSSTAPKSMEPKQEVYLHYFLITVIPLIDTMYLSHMNPFRPNARMALMIAFLTIVARAAYLHTL